MRTRASFPSSQAADALIRLVVGAILCAPSGRSAAAEPAARPVFQVDAAYPTKDKPQSKLWFARGAWWAWLPKRGGSGVWMRTASGWRRQVDLDRALEGLPGQADVWADEDTVRAVLAAPGRLAVAALRWDSEARRYRPDGSPVRFSTPEPGKEGGIESATIDRDRLGRWWIAWNWRGDMWVRWSLAGDGRAWSRPMKVNPSKASPDDLCAIVALPDRVGVVWSDQSHDAVYFRSHLDTAQPGSWNPVEAAARGGKTADDHIHAVAAADGTLYVATKNSVDTVGELQLVLRVRSPRGDWTNHPYALRTEKHQPSRPIVLLGGDPPRLFLLHSLYRMDRPRPPQSTIAWQVEDLPPGNLAAEARSLIDAGARLNDVTGCKSRLPAGRMWIVLASDQAGNVYEGRLDGRPPRNGPPVATGPAF